MNQDELENYYKTEDINKTKLFNDLKELNKKLDIFYSIYLKEKIQKINKTNEKNSKLEIYASNDINKTSISNTLEEIKNNFYEQYINKEDQEILKYHAIIKFLEYFKELDILHCKREDMELQSSIKKELSSLQNSLGESISFEVREVYQKFMT